MSLDRASYLFDPWEEVTDDLKESWEALVDTYIAKYGTPEFGSRRMAFMTDTHVFKVPRNFDGIRANTEEAAWDAEWLPIADCELIEEMPSGIPVLRMERVTMADDNEKLPDWTMSVDCQQVGYTASGKLVAFDL